MRNPERGLLEELIATAGDFYSRGWMWGTSGNLSVRLSSAPLTIGITGTGVSKGRMSLADVAIVPGERRPALPWLPESTARPSAETAIHMAVYERLPEAGAVYHIHTIATSLLSALEANAAQGPHAYLEVRDLEMLKGWGIGWRDDVLEARVPVLPNRPGMEALAEDVAALLAEGASVPAFLVAGHGMTVWGQTPEEARNRVEVAEFLCQVLWQQRSSS